MKEKETRNETASNLPEEACVGKPKDGGRGGGVWLLIHASGPLPEQENFKSPFGPFARSKAPGEVQSHSCIRGGPCACQPPERWRFDARGLVEHCHLRIWEIHWEMVRF